MTGITSERLLGMPGGLLLLGVVLLLLGSLAVLSRGSVGQANRSVWVLAHLLLVFGGVAILVRLPARPVARLAVIC